MIIVEESNEETWSHYKPEANLKERTDCNRIHFAKKLADAVNIYRRSKPDEEWEFIGTAVHSPFDDHDTEEPWEYMICGVKGQNEIGEPVTLFAAKSGQQSS